MPAIGARFSALVAIVALAASCGGAPGAWYLGAYKITRAQTAPWVAPGFVPDVIEIASYLDKSITLGKSIEGPSLLACANPKYELKNVPAEYLFQGTLAEHLKPGMTADQAAAALGFRKGEIEAVETGCEHDINLHFSDHDHAAFALDNTIYWMERQK